MLSYVTLYVTLYYLIPESSAKKGNDKTAIKENNWEWSSGTDENDDEQAGINADRVKGSNTKKQRNLRSEGNFQIDDVNAGYDVDTNDYANVEFEDEEESLF